jgi:hypothetical protein
MAVGFVDGMNEWTHIGEYMGVLGQSGFFDRFKVNFDSRRRHFDLEP